VTIKNSSTKQKSVTKGENYSVKTFVTIHGRQRLQEFLPQLDEFYFTTAEKKILENCRFIVPNFMNESE
jgi:hypothetical protein